MQKFGTIQAAWRPWVYKYRASFPSEMQLINLLQYLSQSNIILPQASPSAIQINIPAFPAPHRSKVYITREHHAASHCSVSSSLEYGRQHVSPLRIHPFPSSRCDLHHPLRADDSPPCLPAHQDPRLVSDTHSHRRSLYAAFASLPPIQKGPTR